MEPTSRWKKELALFAGLIVFGLVFLPLAVYWVGVQIIGEYSPDAGPFDLLGDVWTGLGQGELLAWTLVLGPYAVVQLLRLSQAAWRSVRTVSNVTVSDDYQ